MQTRSFFGLPSTLLLGYLGVGLFMTGDGIEQAFLSRYVVDIGFSTEQASLLFVVYGLAVAIASWLSGVLAEVWHPKRLMFAGVFLWLLFHVMFLAFGLAEKNFAVMLAAYGIRGISYPMFIYGFVVWITMVVSPERMASAMGWFWTMFALGLGVFGSFIPSITIPILGYMGTLWMALAWVALSGVVLVFLKMGVRRASAPRMPRKKLSELSKAITILYSNRNVTLAVIVRIINQLSLFGFVVFMPLVFTDEFGYTIEQWLRIWAMLSVTAVFTNVLWGNVGDRIGWLKVVRIVGCLGCAVSALAFFYLPEMFKGNVWVGMGVSALLGVTISGFVPMSALFPALEPEHKGAAVSAHNLSAGLSHFMAPGLVGVIMALWGAAAVVWTFAGLYLLAFVLACFIKVEQPGLTRPDQKASLRTQAAH
ncbi:MFS transporter [Pseudomonas putida]|uniref:MFS transporter n=1 Tax=Pseudomonas putida TaxID=303 RepID=UPI0018D6F94D|nr:MFS transporter [Pseudomonas putida]MBH3470567.1 MFS transporter [Pseudomonas putida]